MKGMTTPIPGPDPFDPAAAAADADADARRRAAVAVCLAVLAALAVAMGVGRFAFTPLFPLMVRDGLLDARAGALLAGANYLGYLVGALVAGRVPLRPPALLALGLVGTVAITAAVGWTAALPAWVLLRFLAGVMSAWALVAVSAWGLGWLAALGRPDLAGMAFTGVGLGIAGAGLFCLLAGALGLAAHAMWIDLAGLAALIALLPLAVSRRLPAPPDAAPAPAPAPAPAHAPAHARAPAPVYDAPAGVAADVSGKTGSLVVCYTLFGFGYILPATYLPALARQLVDDPRVFGLAWPLFGAAAALSTVLASWRLARANRLLIWSAGHLVMALGVILPAVWTSLAGVTVAALLVGGTFMVITLAGMQEARARAAHQATAVLGRMTAGFALGQLAGPLVNAAIGHAGLPEAAALRLALGLSAAGLVAASVVLWREARRTPAPCRDTVRQAHGA
jgi:MFS family permease